jgi:hypothetical protein
MAEQVVAALPGNADLEDLRQFLAERARVEEGRDEVEAGRVMPSPAALKSSEADVVWTEGAARELDELLENAREHLGGAAARLALVDAVRRAVSRLASGDGDDFSLAEMGDKTIRESHLLSDGHRYRLVFDASGAVRRILWFTTSITCYRNNHGWGQGVHR